MKNQPTNPSRRAATPQTAFTLIEMIGVLTIIAVLAAVLLPALIKEADKAVADQESATLQSFGSAVQNNVMRTRSIPDNTTWISVVTAELGMNSALVATNFRQQPRYFLIDTVGFGSLTLPYSQTSAGASRPPNPRFMIVSSLGRALPVLNSRPATADFNNLWNSTPTAFPTTGAWAGWTGNPNDVTVQRINLSSLFVHLILTTNNSTATGNYSIDPAGATNAVIGGGLNTFFLQNSILNLYSNAVVDSRQILTHDNSFVYDQNVWRSSITSISATATNPPDFSGIVNAFVASGLPTGTSGTNTPPQLANDFINYMAAYNTWANASFSSALKPAALAAYATMMADVNGLVNTVKP